MSLTVLVLLALAAFRATQLATRDSIAAPPRDRFVTWAMGRGWPMLGELVECGWCAGYWLSGVTLLVYLLATGRWSGDPVLVHGVEWFAVAGLQGALQQVIVTSKEQAEAAGAIAEDAEE